MHKIVTVTLTAISIAFCAVILFFTFFGERLYYDTKPKVEYVSLSMSVNGNRIVPASAVYEEGGKSYVYAIVPTTGFSARIYTLSKIEITVNETVEDYIYPGENALITVVDTLPSPGLNVVSKCNEEISDGIRVLPVESLE